MNTSKPLPPTGVQRSLCSPAERAGPARGAPGVGIGVVQSALQDLEPEAAYFTTLGGGQRGGFVVFDLKDSSDLPRIAEPFFMGLNATVEFTPVMNADDLKAGLGKMKL